MEVEEPRDILIYSKNVVITINTAKFKKFYYAHLTMKNVTTHSALLENIRRDEIIFGMEQLVFSRAMSYRPSRIKQSTAQSNSSQASNDAYEYQEPDSYEFDIAKQLEKRRNESVQVRQEDRASRSDTFNRLTKSKRLREDDDV